MRTVPIKVRLLLIGILAFVPLGCSKSAEPLIYDDYSAATAVLLSAEVSYPAILVLAEGGSTNDRNVLREVQEAMPRDWQDDVIVVRDRGEFLPLADLDSGKTLGRLEKNAGASRYLPPSGAYGLNERGEVLRLSAPLKLESFNTLYRILVTHQDLSAYRTDVLDLIRSRLIEELPVEAPGADRPIKPMALFADVCFGCPNGAVLEHIMEEGGQGRNWVVFMPSEYRSLLDEAKNYESLTVYDYDPIEEPFATLLLEISILGQSFPLIWDPDGVEER